MRRPSCELMLRILLVAGDCRNSGSSASVSILAPWKLVLRTVSACSTELVSISLKDTAALFTCSGNERSERQTPQSSVTSGEQKTEVEPLERLQPQQRFSMCLSNNWQQH